LVFSSSLVPGSCRSSVDLFLSWLCLFTPVLSEIGREVTRKVGFAAPNR
jgi:hypothetical protein